MIGRGVRTRCAEREPQCSGPLQEVIVVTFLREQGQEPGWVPVQPSLGKHALAGDWLISRGPFQLLLFCVSVSVHDLICIY